MVNCYEGCLPVYVVGPVIRLLSGGVVRFSLRHVSVIFFLNFHYYDLFSYSKLRFFSLAGDWPAVGHVPEGENIYKRRLALSRGGIECSR